MRAVALVWALLLAIASAPQARTDSAVTVPVTQWRVTAEGLERTVIEVATDTGWRTRIVVVRVNPSRFRFRLRARLNGTRPGWTFDRAPRRAVRVQRRPVLRSSAVGLGRDEWRPVPLGLIAEPLTLPTTLDLQYR
jgi:hypothetical protein